MLPAQVKTTFLADLFGEPSVDGLMG